MLLTVSIKLFTLNSNPELTQEIADYMGVQLSVAKILGQGILNIIDDKAISDLFNYNPNNKLR